MSGLIHVIAAACCGYSLYGVLMHLGIAMSGWPVVFGAGLYVFAMSQVKG